jgi:hypothetical protein
MHSGALYNPQATGRNGGLGYLNAFEFVVATAAQLETNINDAAPGGDATSPLATGALAIVNGATVKELWSLDTASTAAADGTKIVNSQSSAAGVNPGRWFLISALNAFTPPAAALIYSPLNPGGSTGNIVVTWAEVVSAVNAANGDIEIAVDTTFQTPAPITADLDGLARMSLISAIGPRAQVSITTGVQLKNVRLFRDLDIISTIAASGTPPLVFNKGTALLNQYVQFYNTVILPTAGSTVGAMIEQASRAVFFVDATSNLDGQGVEPGAAVAMEVQAALGVSVISTTESRLGTVSFRVPAGGVLNLDNDASVPFPVLARQLGTVNYTWIDIAARTGYDDTLVSPPIVVGPSATAPGGPEVQDAIDALKPFYQAYGPVVGPATITVTHGKGQATPFVVVYDNSVPPQVIIPDLIEAPTGNSVDVTFAGVGVTYQGTIAVRI